MQLKPEARKNQTCVMSFRDQSLVIQVNNLSILGLLKSQQQKLTACQFSFTEIQFEHLLRWTNGISLDIDLCNSKNYMSILKSKAPEVFRFFRFETNEHDIRQTKHISELLKVIFQTDLAFKRQKHADKGYLENIDFT